MATTPAGFTHITVPNADGDGNTPTSKTYVNETYKVPQATADALAHMATKPTGASLALWLQGHGGVLDDANGNAGREQHTKDGSVIKEHYANGVEGKDEVVKPKAVAARDRAQEHEMSELLTTLFMPGIYPVAQGLVDTAHAGHSRFGTTAPAAAAPATTTTAAAVKPVVAKPPKPT